MHEKRRDPRKPEHKSVQIFWIDGQGAYYGEHSRTLDVSENGVSVALRQKPSPADYIVLRFDEGITVNTILRRVSQAGVRYVAGLELMSGGMGR